MRPLTIVPARAIGLMKMKDQNRTDDKIIAVALGDPDYNGYRNLKDLPSHRLAVIHRFFNDYKALENKTVVVKDFCPVRDARDVFVDALKTLPSEDEHVRPLTTRLSDSMHFLLSLWHRV